MVLSWLSPLGKKIKFGVNATVSFYATTLNPYYFVEKEIPNAYALYKDYERIQYWPMEVTTYIDWNPSAKWSLRTDYQYRKTFFFHSQYVGLTLRTILFHDRK